MNTDTNLISLAFQGIQFVSYFVVGATLAIYALRAASHKSVRSTRLFEWDESGETPRWQPVEPAYTTGNFGWTWGKWFGPRWNRRNDQGDSVSVATVGPDEFKPTDEHADSRWLGEGNKYYLLVSPIFAVPTWLWIVDLIGIILIVGALFFAKPSVRVYAVPTATATRVISTPTVLNTRTPTAFPGTQCNGHYLTNGGLVLTAYPAVGTWWRESALPIGSTGPTSCPTFTVNNQIALWDFETRKWLLLEPVGIPRINESYWIVKASDALTPILLYKDDINVGFVSLLEKVYFRGGNKFVYKDVEYSIQEEVVILYFEK